MSNHKPKNQIMKKLFLRWQFFVLLCLMAGVSTSVSAQQTQDTPAPEQLVDYRKNPDTKPANFLDTAGDAEVTQKMNESADKAMFIFESLKSGNVESFQTLIPSFEQFKAFMEASYFTNASVRKKMVKNIDAWYADMVQRITDSYQKVRAEGAAQGFSWSTVRLVEVINNFKQDSQYAGGKVILKVVDEKGQQHEIVLGSLFETQGEWLMWNYIKLRK